MRPLRYHSGWLFASTPVIAFLFFVGLTSCTSNEGGLARTDANAHGVHNQQLQEAMRDLGYKSKEEVAAELYTGSNVTPTSMDGLVGSAGAMAKTAERIPDLVANAQLTADERSQFVALAKQLAANSRELQTQARNGNMAGARQAMDRVNSTCDACHSRFRFVAQ